MGAPQLCAIAAEENVEGQAALSPTGRLRYHLKEASRRTPTTPITNHQSQQPKLTLLLGSIHQLLMKYLSPLPTTGYVGPAVQRPKSNACQDFEFARLVWGQDIRMLHL